MTNLLVIWVGPIVSCFGEKRLEEDFVWGLCWQAGGVAGPMALMVGSTDDATLGRTHTLTATSSSFL
eukprot:scaffold69974_cov51-Attheya_sp.AAC.5